MARSIVNTPAPPGRYSGSLGRYIHAFGFRRRDFLFRGPLLFMILLCGRPRDKGIIAGRGATRVAVILVVGAGLPTNQEAL